MLPLFRSPFYDVVSAHLRLVALFVTAIINAPSSHLPRYNPSSRFLATEIYIYIEEKADQSEIESKKNDSVSIQWVSASVAVTRLIVSESERPMTGARIIRSTTTAVRRGLFEA